jgi:hypothetical protein
MKAVVLLTLSIWVVRAAMIEPAGHGAAAAQPAGRGTIKGHVRLSGKLPGNPVIRMGRDPMCAKLNAGKRVIQETVVASIDGSMANVFVKIQGAFPGTPVPTDAVSIDQRGCIYIPRMVGVRIGQTLQVRNSDALLHNVHSFSSTGNGFNVGQPIAGMVNQFRLNDEEVMVRLKCDLHSWMAAYIGVVSHPYFAVTGGDGTFMIPNVPVGPQTVQIWHEQYGLLTERVSVKASATSTVELTYSGNEKQTARVQDVTLR